MSLARLCSHAPEYTEAVIHLPMPLSGKTLEEATKELVAILDKHQPDAHWLFSLGTDANGKYFAEATPFLSKFASQRNLYVNVALSDIHSRLFAWWITQLWRAEELTSAGYDALSRWHILVAAACSRSLLEGAASFSSATQEALTLWNNFKILGEPKLPSLQEFSEVFSKKLAEAQHGSRLKINGRSWPLVSTNVITEIKKLAKAELSVDVIDIYQWLCDAVHPSLGSTTVYTATRGMHVTKTHMIEKYMRMPLDGMPEAGLEIPATVAEAAADAIIVSVATLLRDLHRLRWLIADFGLTSKLAFYLDLNYGGRMDQPRPNDPCPCRSGKKFKKCSHQWGTMGLPPEVLPDDPLQSAE